MLEKGAEVAEESGRYPGELLEAAEALTELVAADEPFQETMSRLARLAVKAIDGAEVCSVSLANASGKNLKTAATTSEIGEKIDELQRQTREGPCMSSIEDDATFHIPDMKIDETWPTFSKRASEETGVMSMLSFVLRLSDEDTGAMNMISTEKDAFSDEDLDAGTLFAAQAAVAMSDALGHSRDQDKIDQLEGALKTRQMIGQAVGILMATRRIDADEAFDVLRKVSQTSNTKLRDIAEKVVERSQEM